MDTRMLAAASTMKPAENERQLTSGFVATCIVWGFGLLTMSLVIAGVAQLFK